MCSREGLVLCRHVVTPTTQSSDQATNSELCCSEELRSAGVICHLNSYAPFENTIHAAWSISRCRGVLGNPRRIQRITLLCGAADSIHRMFLPIAVCVRSHQVTIPTSRTDKHSLAPSTRAHVPTSMNTTTTTSATTWKNIITIPRNDALTAMKSSRMSRLFFRLAQLQSANSLCAYGETVSVMKRGASSSWDVPHHWDVAPEEMSMSDEGAARDAQRGANNGDHRLFL